jgi:hypothetical protein
MGLQVLGTDKILRMNDFSLLGLVQSEDWAPNFNAQDVMEMGNTARVDTAYDLETSGTLELESVGNIPGLLARMAVQRDVNGTFTGYLYSSANKNAYTLDQDDMREMVFDLLMYERPDQLHFTRSLWFPRCFMTGVQGRFDANGAATETINWAGQDVIGLKNPYHDTRSIPAVYTSSSSLTLSPDAAFTSANYTLAYCYINEKRFRTTNTDPTYVTKSANVINVTTTESYSVPADAVGRVLVYRTTPSTTFPSIVSGDRQTPAFFLRGYQTDLFIGVANAATPLGTEQWLRVQTLDYSIDLRMETLRQIAFNRVGSSIYARVPTFPIDITVNASTNETDWDDWRAILTTTTGVNVYSDQFDLAPEHLKGSSATPLMCVAKSYTKDGNLLQEWRFTDLRMEGYANRANVGGRGEVNWGMKGTQFTLIGYNVA